jgi:hypothetical protein
MDYTTALFETRSDVDQAIKSLETIGLTQNDISIMYSDDSRGHNLRVEEHSKADQGLAAGATFGALVCGVLAAFFGAGALTIPVLNLITAGSLVAGMSGAGFGAVTGGIIGGIIGATMKENEVKANNEVNSFGNCLVSVRSHNADQKREVENILNYQQKHQQRTPDLRRISRS